MEALHLKRHVKLIEELGHTFVEPTKIIKGTNKFGEPCTWAKYQYLGIKNKENL
jgi:hypothetical protein